MVLTKWFITKSGSLARKELCYIFIVAGIVMFIPMLASLFLGEPSIIWRMFWNFLLLAIVGACFFIGGILGLYLSKH